MAYGTAAGVSALVPAVGALNASSLPTLAQVEAWLAQGAATIDRTLADAGYAMPVSPAAGVYPELTALNELYAAAYVVMARGLDSVSGQSENRSSQWMQQFHDRLAALADSDSLPGVVRVAPQTAATLAGRVRFTPVRRVDGYSRRWDDLDVDA